MQQHKIQCFHGEQVKHYNIEKTKAYNNGKVKYNKIIEHQYVPPVNLQQSVPKPAASSHVQIKRNKRHNMHLEHKPSDEMDLMISAVNDADLGWKADTCKYQKTHPKYGAHCD